MQRSLHILLWSGLFFFHPWLHAKSHADVFTDVPAAKSYKLVYTLNIPTRGGFAVKNPIYGVDNSSKLKGSFRRVAYYLELQPKRGKRQFIYVAMDAFTQDLRYIGVPHSRLKKQWQQKVYNLEVLSSVPGIKTGTNMQGGHLEFWPTNYVTRNTVRVPNASDRVYDTGDQPIAVGNYGSMQIHNSAAKQTLFAYNNWGLSNTDSDIGIGNNTVKAGNVTHTDWTFRHNAALYTKRTLQILVLPGNPPPRLSFQIQQPQSHQIVQRQQGNRAWVPLQGTMRKTPDQLDARAVSITGGKTTSWQRIALAPKAKSFTGRLNLTTGWYRLQVRFRSAGQPDDIVEVAPFGVGEVFVIAGQSNSANSGKPAMKASDPRVSTYGDGRWGPAYDPMPVATGNGGSPWPILGDLLTKSWQVPIAFLSVGWGGTNVTQWQPGPRGQLYPRLKEALRVVGKNGARAVLWHQGESDAHVRTTAANYARLLNNIIRQSRTDAKWDIPWYIAGASYLPGLSLVQMQQVRQGQTQVVNGHPQNFAGPVTDDMIGKKWRHDNVHFNEAGLREHAARWQKVLRLPRCQGFANDCEKIDEMRPQERPTESRSEQSREAETEAHNEPHSSKEAPGEASTDAGARSEQPQPDLLFPETTQDTKTPRPEKRTAETPTIDAQKQPEGHAPEAKRQREASPQDAPPTSGCDCTLGARSTAPWWWLLLLALLFLKNQQVQGSKQD